MLGNIQSLSAAMLVRRCVECGYDGSLLKNGQAPRCARCGCDLQQRPARSYAEMEGLIETAEHPSDYAATILRSMRRSQPRMNSTLDVPLRHRWVMFLFLMSVLLGAIACLSFAAVGAV